MQIAQDQISFHGGYHLAPIHLINTHNEYQKTIENIEQRLADIASRPAPEPVTPQVIVPSRRINGHLPVVVICEDEPEIAIVIHRLFRYLTEQYDIRVIEDPEKIVEFVQERPVGLILLDYIIASYEAFSIPLGIKRASPQTKIAIVSALSGFPYRKHIEERGKAAKIDYYLYKQFPLDKVESLIKEGMEAYLSHFPS